jgi:hypothetical protein
MLRPDRGANTQTIPNSPSGVVPLREEGIELPGAGVEFTPRQQLRRDRARHERCGREQLLDPRACAGAFSAPVGRSLLRGFKDLYGNRAGVAHVLALANG